jgi:hypothetical protein
MAEHRLPSSSISLGTHVILTLGGRDAQRASGRRGPPDRTRVARERGRAHVAERVAFFGPGSTLVRMAPSNHFSGNFLRSKGVLLSLLSFCVCTMAYHKSEQTLSTNALSNYVHRPENVYVDEFSH